MNANLQMKSQKGFATVWGRARYWQNSTTAKPIKQARVKIIDFNTNQVLGEGKTDNNGEYWITIYLDGSRDIYAKILCESEVAIVKEGTSNNFISEGVLHDKKKVYFLFYFLYSSLFLIRTSNCSQ
jgi:hypothetical protein